MVHVLHGGQVHAQGVGDGRQIESELDQEIDEIHLVSGEGVAERWTGEVALRPRTRVETPVTARVRVLLDVVDVVDVEQHRRSTVTRFRSVHVHTCCLAYCIFVITIISDF